MFDAEVNEGVAVSPSFESNVRLTPRNAVVDVVVLMI